LDRLASGRLGPLFRGDDTRTGELVVIKRFDIRVGPERMRQLADDLAALVQRLPDDPYTVRVLAGGLDDRQLTLVTTLAPGEGLDAALREYGPAALVDAVPRLEHIAGVLDRAAARGIWHGALNPRDIIVSATDTRLTGLGVAPILEAARVPIEPRPPYTAPEGGGEGERAWRADQFALAAIAHEWLFGAAVTGPAESAVMVPSLPGVDREALADAFTTALAPDPDARFESCGAFVAALRRAAHLSEASHATPPVIESDLPIGQLRFNDALLDAPFESETTRATETAADPAREASVAWRGGLGGLAHAETPTATPSRTAYGALAAMFAAGLLLGAAGGYLLADRAPSGDPSPALQSMDQVAPAPAAPGPAAADPGAVTDIPVRRSDEPPPAAAAAAAPAPAPSTAVPPAVVPAPSAPAPGAAARLLVRSSPPGASVSVDGTVRGTTPLTLRDVPIGTRTIRLQRTGYQPVEQRIVLSADRPSRSIDVRLMPVARAATALRPPPVATGRLLVESRPPGARVTIDGRDAGVTPLTIASIAPGRHTVLITAPGWAPVTSTVDVKAGARARVAATLEGGRQEE
jgi:hypothetical protein